MRTEEPPRHQRKITNQSKINDLCTFASRSSRPAAPGAAGRAAEPAAGWAGRCRRPLGAFAPWRVVL